MEQIHLAIACPHTQSDILLYCQAIFDLPPAMGGVIVEAGCFKGGSTAKLSLAAALTGRKLVVFDSFAGLPSNTEPHDRTIFGGRIVFNQGDYAGSLPEVIANVGVLGRIDVCRFVPGWFAHSLPTFHEPVALAILDVDLVESTRTCLTWLLPLLQPGGSILSHDGHLPLVIKLLRNEEFWRSVNIAPPRIEGLGDRKVIRIVPKPTETRPSDVETS